MIHSNELRIGNYLEYYIPTDDLGWQTTQADWQDIRLCHEQNESFNLENRPIPLTEEWLLKFGFENEKENHFNIGWFSIWKCNDMFLCDKNGVILKTVHQLQNLYFSIYQTELKMIK